MPEVELGVARASCESGSGSVTQHRQPQPGLACVGLSFVVPCLCDVAAPEAAPGPGLTLYSKWMAWDGVEELGVTLETVYVCSSGRLLICNPPALVLK